MFFLNLIFGELSQPGERKKKEKKEGAKGANGFFGAKKWAPSRHIMRKKEILRSPYLEDSFQQVAKNKRRNPKVYYSPPLTSSQIWLIPLGHARQPTTHLFHKFEIIIIEIINKHVFLLSLAFC